MEPLAHTVTREEYLASLRKQRVSEGLSHREASDPTQRKADEDRYLQELLDTPRSERIPDRVLDDLVKREGERVLTNFRDDNDARAEGYLTPRERAEKAKIQKRDSQGDGRS